MAAGDHGGGFRTAQIAFQGRFLQPLAEPRTYFYRDGFFRLNDPGNMELLIFLALAGSAIAVGFDGAENSGEETAEPERPVEP
ncbi:hypothetical protein [Leisingera sp. ANG-DT]|uniref:hypothetical protein n=1 Tax=Leisingera sp. ANG-DT TaxID=1577897 RepID=UPI0019D3D8BA|nr:hypothetical protein [Leisingera sp. ANG-DT]